jgi:elongation factor Ts
MAYTAADVKKLREETDAPMMECKAALDEADGNLERAKEILREKGKAAAAKRVGRSTSAGVVAFAASPDNLIVGGVVVESETDFVARNEEFIGIVQSIAELVRDGEAVDGEKIKGLIEGAVAKIRENIKVTKSVRIAEGKPVLTYTHHDRTKGAAVVIDGDAVEELKKVAIQVVSLPPEVLSKDQLSADKIAKQIEIEVQRAINEGKDPKMAENIAKGRVNKEFVKEAVLLEQPFYLDPKKSVGQYVAEVGKGATVVDFAYLAIGQGEE